MSQHMLREHPTLLIAETFVCVILARGALLRSPKSSRAPHPAPEPDGPIVAGAGKQPVSPLGRPPSDQVDVSRVRLGDFRDERERRLGSPDLGLENADGVVGSACDDDPAGALLPVDGVDGARVHLLDTRRLLEGEIALGVVPEDHGPVVRARDQRVAVLRKRNAPHGRRVRAERRVAAPVVAVLWRAVGRQKRGRAAGFGLRGPICSSPSPAL